MSKSCKNCFHCEGCYNAARKSDPDAPDFDFGESCELYIHKEDEHENN